MLFRFLILSDEVDDFKREIEIDSEATFQDLHDAILDSVEFTKDQMCSFFICEDDWSKKTEITLVDMDTSSDVDSYIMKDTCLEELIEDEEQKVLFVFDYLTERALFMEVVEIVTGKSTSKATCLLSEGLPPEQFVSFDEFETKLDTTTVDEDFFGDSEYNPDELDEAGFEGLDDNPMSNPFEDERF